MPTGITRKVVPVSGGSGPVVVAGVVVVVVVEMCLKIGQIS